MYTQFLMTNVYAAEIVWPQTRIDSISSLVNIILPILYGIVGMILFALFVYGGFLWLISAGDPDKIRKGVDTMINAAIGVAIIIFAYFMTRAVGGILGVDLT